jgi:hypothetical protein
MADATGLSPAARKADWIRSGASSSCGVWMPLLPSVRAPTLVMRHEGELVQP